MGYKTRSRPGRIGHHFDFLHRRFFSCKMFLYEGLRARCSIAQAKPTAHGLQQTRFWDPKKRRKAPIAKLLPPQRAIFGSDLGIDPSPAHGASGEENATVTKTYSELGAAIHAQVIFWPGDSSASRARRTLSGHAFWDAPRHAISSAPWKARGFPEHYPNQPQPRTRVFRLAKKRAGEDLSNFGGKGAGPVSICKTDDCAPDDELDATPSFF